MIPLLLFLIACAMIYVGALEAAFSALMRLSLAAGVDIEINLGGRHTTRTSLSSRSRRRRRRALERAHFGA